MAIFLLITCLLMASSLQAKPSLQTPKLGQNQKLVQNIMSQLLDEEYQYPSGPRYSPAFRPPSTDLEPILVEFGIDSFHVMDYDERNQTMTVEFNLIAEYKDSRLIYKAPSDVKFIPLESYQIWQPQFQIPNARNVRHGGRGNENPEVLVSPDGRVLIKNPLMMDLLSSEAFPAQQEYNFQIVGRGNDVGAMKFAWKGEAVTFLKPEAGEGAKVRKFSIRTTHESCEHKEAYGSFGTRSFGCLELNILIRQPYMIDIRYGKFYDDIEEKLNRLNTTDGITDEHTPYDIPEALVKEIEESRDDDKSKIYKIDLFGSRSG